MSPVHHHPVRRRAILPAVVLAVSAVLTGLAGCSSTSGTSGTSGASGTSGTPGAGSTAAHGNTTVRDTTAPARAAGAAPQVTAPAVPTKVRIPSLGISSALLELGLNADGTVEVPPPDKGMTAGWYTGGAVPGAAGAAVIIGHNDTRYGRAIFHDLRKIAKGADITVTDARGRSAHFTVTGTESVSKKAFPTQRVYGPTTSHALRLITCDGSFDTNGHPVNNLIVYATQT